MNKKELKNELMNKHRSFLELLELVGGILQSSLLQELCIHFNIYKNKTAYYRAIKELVDNKVLNKTARGFISLTKTARAFVLGIDSYNVKAVKTDLVNYVIKAKTLRAVYFLNNFSTVSALKDNNSSLFLNDYVYLNNLYHFYSIDKNKVLNEFNISYNRNLKVRSNLKGSIINKSFYEDEFFHVADLLQDNRLFVSSINNRHINLCILDYSANLNINRVQDYYVKCITAFRNIFLDKLEVKILLLEDSANVQFKTFKNVNYVEVVNLDCKKYY